MMILNCTFICCIIIYIQVSGVDNVTRCHRGWHISTCHAPCELSLLTVFTHRWLHKHSVTIGSVTSYFLCHWFTPFLDFLKYALLLYIAIRSVIDLMIIIMSIMMITASILITLVRKMNPKSSRKGRMR